MERFPVGWCMCVLAFPSARVRLFRQPPHDSLQRCVGTVSPARLLTRSRPPPAAPATAPSRCAPSWARRTCCTCRRACPRPMSRRAQLRARPELLHAHAHARARAPAAHGHRRCRNRAYPRPDTRSPHGRARPAPALRNACNAQRPRRRQARRMRARRSCCSHAARILQWRQQMGPVVVARGRRRVVAAVAALTRQQAA